MRLALHRQAVHEASVMGTGEGVPHKHDYMPPGLRIIGQLLTGEVTDLELAPKLPEPTTNDVAV